MKWLLAVLLLLPGCVGFSEATVRFNDTEFQYTYPGNLNVTSAGGQTWETFLFSSDVPVIASMGGETTLIDDAPGPIFHGPMETGDLVHLCAKEGSTARLTIEASYVRAPADSGIGRALIDVPMETCP